MAECVVGASTRRVFKPKPWMHSIQLTDHAVTLLALRSTEAGMSRGDYLNAIVLDHAAELDMGQKTGCTYWPGKGPRPLTFRFTGPAHRLVLEASQRLACSEGDIIEGLIRGGFSTAGEGPD